MKEYMVLIELVEIEEGKPQIVDQQEELGPYDTHKKAEEVFLAATFQK